MKEREIRPKELYDEFIALVNEEVKERFAHVRCDERDCPACLGKDCGAVFNKFGFQYSECNRCMTIFVNPVPSQEMINRYYRDSKALRFFAERLYEVTKVARSKKIFGPRARLVRDLINDLKLKKSTVVDIGGGTGLLANELGKFNIRCQVIEPSVELARKCQKSDILTCNKFFEEINLDELCDSPFILTSFELVEHLRDPERFFRHAYENMKQGGFFIFTTLSSTGFDLRMLWDKSRSFLPPLHLTFFNPGSVRILLERIGFDVVDISTPGKLDWDIVESMMNEEGVSLGRFWDLFAREASLQCKKDLQDWLSMNKLSSHMRVIVRK